MVVVGEKGARGAYPERCLCPVGPARSRPHEPPSSYLLRPRLSTHSGRIASAGAAGPGGTPRLLPGRAAVQLPRLREGLARTSVRPGRYPRAAVPAGAPPRLGPHLLAAARLPALRRLRPTPAPERLWGLGVRPRLPATAQGQARRRASPRRRLGAGARQPQPPAHRLVLPPGH